MSQIHTRRMGRLVASGTLDKLDATIEMLAQLRALHLVDYDGEDDDLSMGAPRDSAEQLSRDVNKLRNAAGAPLFLVICIHRSTPSSQHKIVSMKLSPV